VLQLLLAAGADVDAAAADGSTALHYAAQRGHAAVVQLLVDAKGKDGALYTSWGTVHVCVWARAWLLESLVISHMYSLCLVLGMWRAWPKSSCCTLSKCDT
jgi:ankyrin repeat protein